MQTEGEIEPGWYVALAGYRAEKRAEERLRDAGFEAYVPRETRWSRSGGRKHAAERPLLPRYVFVRLGDGQSFHAARACDGVEGMIAVCGRPARIPGDWIDGLRSAEALGVFDKTHTARKTFESGQQVQIIAGPFKDQVAKFVEQTSDAGRVRVMFELFSAQIDVRELKAA